MRPWEALGFDWATERVIEKLAARCIWQYQVEEVFWNGAAYKRNAEGKTGDWLMIGLTNASTPLTIVVLTMGEMLLLRPITGWPSEDGEVRYYEERRR